MGVNEEIKLYKAIVSYLIKTMEGVPSYTCFLEMKRNPLILH